MALVNTGLVDDNFKVIKVITGKKNEDELIVEVEKLKGSTNESKISVANVYYEVVNEKVNNVEQDGKVTLQFDDSDPFLTLQGKDNVYTINEMCKEISKIINIDIFII